MKRTITSLLGALAVAAGFFFNAPAINAAVTMTSIERNGVTCIQHNGGDYPEDGRFFTCTNVSASSTDMFSVT